ncbi:MAG: prepilin peptidase [Clostridia bacterium]|nr:prepilin peptidase [Clostridia bacterium]
MSIYDSRPMLIFCVAVAAVLGAVCGSFLNCAAWRIVRGESFVNGRSHCAACGHPLGADELIPVVSWVIQRGKCKWCGQRISARYPLTELCFALLTVLCLLRFDLTVLCLRNFLFLGCLFLLTLTDLEDMTIPDGCHIAAVLIWLAALPFVFTGWGDVARSVAAAVTFGGGLLGISLVMDKIMSRDTLGGGDIKLFAVVGLYLGFVGTLFTVVIACVAGLLLQLVLRRSRDGAAFPFGPSIALAAAVMLLYGAPLVDWYRGLLMK